MQPKNSCARLVVQLAMVSLPAVLPCLGQQSQSAVPGLPAEVPASADRYSVLTMGNLAGQQASWTTPDGTLHLFYQFNDRGRGPQITSMLTFNAEGIPVAETVTGHDYLKSPVAESYASSSGTAHWKSTAEAGEKKLTTTAVYVSINGAPEELGILARVALAHAGKVDLLPAGEATVQSIRALNIEASGHKKTITLYAIGGLDFAPTYVWLDEHRNFFATVDPWSTVIPDGWNAAIKPMQDAQEKAGQDRAVELVGKLAHKPANGIAFTHVNLFDAQSAETLKDRTVVVARNRIRSVGPSNLAVVPSGAQVIDGTGKTLIPGLWDMHAHVAANDGLLNLAAGVTTVRDMANDTDSLLARRKRIEEGKEIGTRIVLAGILDGPGPYQGPTKVLVSTPDEARAAVDNYARLGYVQAKIYSSVKPELVPVIVSEAHQHGMRVSGHIPAQMTAAQCVELGYDEIQHANFLVLNFMPDVKDTNSTSRFTEVARRGADLDLNSPQMKSFIKLLQDHHTVLDPTLGVFEEMIASPPGKMPRGYVPVADRLPPQVRRSLFSIGLTPPAGMEERYQQSFTKMEELVGILYRAGIPIEAGTDSMAGFALHRELELEVEAGIPANRALQNATLNAARIMKMDHDLGSIEPGKLADLTLVDGNPAAHMRDIRKTEVVVKDGVLYQSRELYSALGVAPGIY